MVYFIRISNKHNYEAIAITNNVLSSISFNIIIGFLRFYIFDSSDPLIIVISIEIIFKYYIVTHHYKSYSIMKISSILTMIYLSVEMSLVHEVIPTPVYYHMFLQLLVHTSLSIYSNIYEKQLSTEYRYIKEIEIQRMYYTHILDKLNIGFFVLGKYKLQIVNKTISKIFEKSNFAKCDSQNEQRSNIHRGNISNSSEISKIKQHNATNGIKSKLQQVKEYISELFTLLYSDEEETFIFHDNLSDTSVIDKNTGK